MSPPSLPLLRRQTLAHKTFRGLDSHSERPYCHIFVLYYLENCFRFLLVAIKFHLMLPNLWLGRACRDLLSALKRKASAAARPLRSLPPSALSNPPPVLQCSASPNSNLERGSEGIPAALSFAHPIPHSLQYNISPVRDHQPF